MLKQVDLATKEQMEIDAWRDSPTEAPETDTVENLINKLSDAQVFMECLGRHRDVFERAESILELGAGQGWASCLVKKTLGEGKRIVATDISAHAIASVSKWERVFNVRIDGTHACRSYEVPVADKSVDLVFTYAAAHHFVAHRRTLKEMHRILREGGTCLYFHEPTCIRALHSIARARVNTKGMPVPEDVLVYSNIEKLGREAGFRVSSVFDLSLSKRGPFELMYYMTLRKVPFLKQLLPCTRDIRFDKPRQS